MERKKSETKKEKKATLLKKKKKKNMEFIVVCTTKLKWLELATLDLKREDEKLQNNFICSWTRLDKENKLKMNSESFEALSTQRNPLIMTIDQTVLRAALVNILSNWIENYKFYECTPAGTKVMTQLERAKNKRPKKFEEMIADNSSRVSRWFPDENDQVEVAFDSTPNMLVVRNNSKESIRIFHSKAIRISFTTTYYVAKFARAQLEYPYYTKYTLVFRDFFDEIELQILLGEEVIYRQSESKGTWEESEFMGITFTIKDDQTLTYQVDSFKPQPIWEDVEPGARTRLNIVEEKKINLEIGGFKIKVKRVLC